MPFFCSNCGAQVADNATSCTACGRPIAAAAAPASAAPPPPAAGASTSGLSDTAAGAIAYITFIPAIIFLLTAPYNRNRFVRFHAFQEIFLSAARIVVAIMFWFIPLHGLLLLPFRFLLSLVFFIAWLICIINAAQGKWFKLPIIGDMAEAQANKIA